MKTDADALAANMTADTNGLLLLHEISREIVEAQDIQALKIDCIERFIKNPYTYGHIYFTFSGYDNDTRECCEIQEIREFVAKMFQNIPVMLICTPNSFKTLVMCKGKLNNIVKKNGNTIIGLDKNTIVKIIKEQFVVMDCLNISNQYQMEAAERTIKDRF